jgi:hypothetical protein
LAAAIAGNAIAAAAKVIWRAEPAMMN